MPIRVVLVLLLLISLPYLSALLAAGPDAVFGGFLLNPADGNSYLAKMMQGWSGSWKFTLPYSSDPGQGAILFTFYLLLGHIANGLNLPMLLVFHLARLLGAAAMAWAVWRFYEAALAKEWQRAFAFSLACLGLGLGWTGFLVGKVTSDFWIAEAFPFLSGYANPHFPISLALLLWLLLPALKDVETDKKSIGPEWFARIAHPVFALFASAWLGSMSPFSVVLTLGILGGMVLWEMLSSRSRPVILSNIAQMTWIALGGIPVILYTVAAVRSDSALAAWNSQNLTPTPPAWDLLIAFSPMLLLALPGAWQTARGARRSERLLLVWAVLAFGLAIVPFDLQRRFLAGAYVPLIGLSACGLDFLEPYLKGRLKLFRQIVFGLVIPTTLLVVLVGQYGAIRRDPLLYLERGEARALEWMKANTSIESLVLAGPRIGMFVPGRTGQRVIYGHPFETVHADEEQAAVTSFFRDAADNPQEARRFLSEREVEFVFYGPDERSLGDLSTLNLEEAYSQDGVTVYKVALP